MKAPSDSFGAFRFCARRKARNSSGPSTTSTSFDTFASVPSIYDAKFAPEEVGSFPPGTSPFRQKGSAYLGDFEALEKMVPGGMAALLNAITDERLRTFLRAKFHAGDWYDVLPNLQMQKVAARLRGVSFTAHQREIGMWQAENAARGIYRALLRVVSTEYVALWGPRISAIYHQFGKFETRVTAHNTVDGVRSGVPEHVVQWLMVTTGGFCERALELTGAKNPRMTFGEPFIDGRYSGQDLYSVPSRTTWE